MRNLTLAVIALAVGLVTAAFAFAQQSQADSELVRPESHRLQFAANGVEVVEFLDFECPACRSAYPMVEELRKEHQGELTYVVRMFPLPSHPNAEPAARAAEAAANQGKFEAMYSKLFEGNQLTDFDEYAREIGLDLDRFHADMAASSTSDRIRMDKNDGVAKGVSGTPTFFVNGKKVDLAGLKAAVDKALSDLAPAIREPAK